MAQAHYAATIIPRFIEEDGKTAFFFAESEPVDGKVLAYIEGQGVKELTIEQYRRAGQLHPEDVKVALDIYRKHTGVQEVVARVRMPYKKDAALSAPRRLANIDPVTEQVDVEHDLADTVTDPKSKAVIQAMADKTEQRRKYTKKSDYWFDPSVKKGRARSGKAKTVEAQAASETPASESLPVKSNTRSSAAIERHIRKLEKAAQKKQMEENQGVGAQMFSEAELRAVTERAIAVAMQMLKAA